MCHPSLPRQLLFAFVTVLALLVALPATPIVSQATIDRLRITRIDPLDFPDVTVQFVALDATGTPLDQSSLQPADLRLSDDETDVSDFTLGSKEVGIQVAWVIDAGAGVTARGSTGNPRIEEARDLVLEFLDSNWVRSGTDATTVLARTGSQTLSVAELTTDLPDAAGSLRQYTPSASETTCAILRGVSDALDRLRDRSTGSEQSRFVVALVQCEGLDVSLLDAVVKKAVNSGVPVHVILLRSATDETTKAEEFAPLLDLASQTGGIYLRYDRLKNVSDRLFPALGSHRQQLTLTFRSRVFESGNHTVEVQANTGAAGAASATGTYAVTIEDPQVMILEPMPGGQPRICEASAWNSQDCKVDPTSVTVVAQVTWPDDHPRRLSNAQLLVNENPVGNPLFAPSDPQRIQLAWDLGGHTTIADTTYQLRLEVEDELGRRGTSEPIEVVVKAVIPPPPSVTSLPCPAFVERNAPALCPYVRDTFQLLTFALAAAALIFAVVIYLNRGKVATVAAQASQVVSDFVERVTKPRTNLEPRAFLVAISGMEDAKRRNYEIYDTTRIGSSKRYADLVFQGNEESPVVSRLHVTLNYEDDRFTVRDEDSTNGTYLNGVKLEPMEPQLIQDGDELELAPEERGGIRFLFQLAPPAEDAGRSDGREEDPRATQPRRAPVG